MIDFPGVKDALDVKFKDLGAPDPSDRLRKASAQLAMVLDGVIAMQNTKLKNHLGKERIMKGFRRAMKGREVIWVPPGLSSRPASPWA
eukprot:5957252-Alexandrium_andersonii.AAC.1